MRIGHQCILIDPPWPERGGGKIKRGADKHYKLLPVLEMPRVILGSGVWAPAENAHLWLWTTNNYLPDGLWLMKALGFRYITLATWTKDRIGLGQYLRGKTEQLLFGVRGRLPAVEKGTTSIEARRRAHSQKPEEAYELIERVSPGPRLEMFARSGRDGWDAWGDEAPQKGSLI